nr:hypothetical protein P5627_08035 [Bacillus safensis]
MPLFTPICFSIRMTLVESERSAASMMRLANGRELEICCVMSEASATRRNSIPLRLVEMSGHLLEEKSLACAAGMRGSLREPAKQDKEHSKTLGHLFSH